LCCIMAAARKLSGVGEGEDAARSVVITSCFQ
jgi:hypothetical protein